MAKKYQSFEELEVWKRSRKLTSAIYNEFSNGLERSLKDQILRAALSIMNNIAEGNSRGSGNDYIRFLIIARASAAELRSMLYLCKDIKRIDNQEFSALHEELMIITKMINAIISGLRRWSKS